MTSTLVFDWLRLSATRFYNEQTRASAPELRATLDVGYLGGALLLLALAAAALLLGQDFGMGRAMVGAAALFAVASGSFEFFAALLRARFHNLAYSSLIILKNVLAFASMVGAGYFFRDPTLVMAMAAASVLISTFALWRQTADPRSRLPQASRGQIAAFLRYGAPIVIANIFYQAVMLANRGFAAAHIDFAAAGKLSLATDMTIRLIVVAGAALDILLFQVAVHRRATAGAEAGAAQVARNSALILAALTLLCLGYMANLPAFVALVAPAKFRDAFEPLSLILAPGVALFCVGQFCLNPIAQLEHRTGLALVAALATTALDLGLIWFGPFPTTIANLAMIHSASLAAGFFADDRADLALARLLAARPRCRNDRARRRGEPFRDVAAAPYRSAAPRSGAGRLRRRCGFWRRALSARPRRHDPTGGGQGFRAAGLAPRRVGARPVSEPQAH